MELKNFDLFKKRVDKETGSILYYREDIKGLPDKVISGDGFTVEMKDEEIYLIDIYNSKKVLNKLLKNLKVA